MCNFDRLVGIVSFHVFVYCLTPWSHSLVMIFSDENYRLKVTGGSSDSSINIKGSKPEGL